MIKIHNIKVRKWHETHYSVKLLIEKKTKLKTNKKEESWLEIVQQILILGLCISFISFWSQGRILPYITEAGDCKRGPFQMLLPTKLTDYFTEKTGDSGVRPSTSSPSPKIHLHSPSPNALFPFSGKISLSLSKAKSSLYILLEQTLFSVFSETLFHRLLLLS